MIDFSHISYLTKQHTFIQKKLKTTHAVFLVGWCIRNLLLGIEHSPNDIDVTLAGDPFEIYKHSNKIWLSHFITEKFGTMTFIKKGVKRHIQYEVTPLRTEGWYEDFRHPNNITRSNDILLDAKRRDFTVNSLYFFSSTNKIIWKNISHIIDEKNIISKLDKYWIIALPDYQLVIIQDHDSIHQLFKDGIYQKDKLPTLLEEKNIDQNSEYNYFILDPNQGIQDLYNKKLRAVGDPEHRFQEDALRLLRALRFVNVINYQLRQKKSNTPLFDFDKQTRNALKNNYQLLKNIAKERIKDELIKVFDKGDPFGFIALLDESHLLEVIFPALHATKNIHQPVRYHPFDVYTHTLLTLYELQKINKNYLVRLGMLYHDVGKVAQFSAYKDNLNKEEIREILSWPLNHRKGWPDLVKKDFSALWFSNKEIDKIARYVANHHKPEDILDGENPEQKKKKLRKFLSKNWYQNVEDILDITIADRRGQFNPLQNNADFEDITYLRKLLKQIHKEEWQFTIKELVINGEIIMNYFGLEPSKLIWELLKKAFEWTINDIKTRNKKKEILTYLTGYLKNKKSD